MSVISIEELLVEIATDTPCGEDIEYDPTFAELEKQAQGTPERQYGDTIIAAEPPDWRSVQETALALSARTRDLRVAVYLARSLLNTDGLSGFAEGLALVDGLIERYWDTVYPQLDPDDDYDPTLRVNTIVSLCDPETTLRDLREIPLVESRALGRFSLRDIHIAAGLLTPTAAEAHELPTQSRIDAAFQDTDLATLQATATAAAEAMAQAEQIEVALTGRIGVSEAPDLSGLTGLLKDMRQALVEPLRRRGIDLGVNSPEVMPNELATGSEAGTAGSGRAMALPGEIASREDVIRILDQLCDYFKRYEPSSPVPFLLKRAKILVSKDFMEILNDLAPDGTSQAHLVFGIREESTE